MDRNKIKKIGKILILVGVVFYLIAFFISNISSNYSEILSSEIFTFLALPFIIIGVFFLSLGLLLNRKFKGRKIIFILLILFILFIVDGFIFNYIPKYIAKIAINKKSEFMCNLLPMWDVFDSMHPVNLDRAFLKDNCYKEMALIKKDVKFCNKIEMVARWWRCYIETAIALKDELICRELKNIQGENNSVFSKGAIKDCYVSLAIINKDQSLCEEIEDEEYRNYCIKDFNEGRIYK